jgi:hypothetical protein
MTVPAIPALITVLALVGYQATGLAVGGGAVPAWGETTVHLRPRTVPAGTAGAAEHPGTTRAPRGWSTCVAPASIFLFPFLLLFLFPTFFVEFENAPQLA